MKIPRFALACTVAALQLPALPASAELLAYEDFNYQAEHNLGGAAGGTGWSGRWHQSPDADPVVVETTMSYANGNVAMNNSGTGRALRTPRQNLDNAVTRSFPKIDSDIFISFLYKTDTHGAGSWWNQLWVWSHSFDTNAPAATMSEGGRIAVRRDTIDSAVLGIDALDGETYLVVMHLHWDGAAYTDVSVYVNPDNSKEPGGEFSSLPLTPTSTPPESFSRLGLRVNTSGGNEEAEVFLGELRVGTTWDSVVLPKDNP